MHEADFELVSRHVTEDGAVEFTVRIHAASLERTWRQEPGGAIRLTGPPLLVRGFDMTSIIGKRVREWWGDGRG